MNILSYDCSPQLDVYYLGFLILQKLQEEPDIGFEDLFRYLNKTTGALISLFILTLDFLNIIGFSYMDEWRKELIAESVEVLEDDKFYANVEDVKKMYESVGALVPQLQKRFEDVVVYHNNMINNNIKFIKQELEESPNI